MSKDETCSAVPAERIAQSIIVIRGQRVLLDSDLAALYEVETRRLNEQLHRNRDRFPTDFIFELTDEEFQNLMPVSTHDQAIVGVLKTLRELMRLPEPKKRPIGFTADLGE